MNISSSNLINNNNNNNNNNSIHSLEDYIVTSPTSLAIRESLFTTTNTNNTIEINNNNNNLNDNNNNNNNINNYSNNEMNDTNIDSSTNIIRLNGSRIGSFFTRRSNSEIQNISLNNNNINQSIHQLNISNPILSLNDTTTNNNIDTNSLRHSSGNETNTINNTIKDSFLINSTNSSTTTNNNNNINNLKREKSMTRRSIFRDTVSFLARDTMLTIPENIPISCEGYLTKRGHVVTNWKTRYFVLRGNILQYYNDEQSSRLNDNIKPLGQVTIEKVSTWSGEAHGFMFYTHKKIPYFVYASSEKERNKWMMALKDYIIQQDPVDCEGYLTKRGHLVPSYRLRYFVLRNTSLKYYSDQESYYNNSSAAIAEMEIKNVSAWNGEKTGIMFLTSTGNVLYVYADTIEEQKKWILSLKNKIATNNSVAIQEPVSCAGYLTKQGHKRKSWKKRYFVLRGNKISYYNDFETANTNGMPITEVSIEDVQEWDGEPFGFFFRTCEQVPYYVFAENEKEMKKWINAIKKGAGIDIDNNSNIENTIENKKCPKCSAALTGSRFCGACGYKIRPNTTLSNKNITNITSDLVEKKDENKLININKDEINKIDKLNDLTIQKSDQKENPNDEDAQFDELEALSEGARTLLLAVMQTPEGINIGEADGAFPPRLSRKTVPGTNNNFEKDIDMAIDEEEEEKKIDKQDLYISDDEEEKKQDKTDENDQIHKDDNPLNIIKDNSKRLSSLKSIDRQSSKKIVPRESKNKRFSYLSTDFDDTDEDSEESEDSDDYNTKIKNKNKSKVKKNKEKLIEKKKIEEKQTVEKPVNLKTLKSSSNISSRSIIHESNKVENIETIQNTENKNNDEDDYYEHVELDTRGIMGFDSPNRAQISEKNNTNILTTSNKDDIKEDLYQYFEKELEFTPLYVPSADAPVRSRFYGSMNYTTAKKVIIIISDSGPLGVWKEENNTQSNSLKLPTTAHPYSMIKFVTRAQEEGYGLLVCNPYANNAKVYEEGGRERIVSIPNSSTPKEHIFYLWKKHIMNCIGTINIVAYKKGGILVANLLQENEKETRDKIHRIAFIDSKHVINGNESAGVLELLGRRSINFESSMTENIGGQIVESQSRVGCVCLSSGRSLMTFNKLNNTMTSETKDSINADDCTFAFFKANPERPGMTAIVGFIRATIRRRNSNITSSTTSNYKRRSSNVLVLGSVDNNSGNTNTSNDSTDLTNNNNNNNTKSPEKKIRSNQSSNSNMNYYIPRSVSNRQSNSNNNNYNKQTNQITVKDFELTKIVGQGGFGKVFLAKKKTPPDINNYYAMKVLKKKHVLASGLVNTTMAERHILTEISHPFIVKLHYAFQSDSKLYLVMDYLSGGSLAIHLRRQKRFPEQHARFYAAEIAAAIGHLHSVNIIYRDAKLENVLMDHEGHVRVTDFGLSKVGVSGLQGATTFCGTAAYIAPELLKGNMYGKAADWWSFGILLYEMIGGKPPYYHRNRDIMFQTILKQEWVTFTPAFSDSAVSLIRGLLTRDPTKRLGSGSRGADEVLTHPFFDIIDWEKLLNKKISPPFSPSVGEFDTHYAPRHLINNDITQRDREASVVIHGPPGTTNDFDGFSFVGKIPTGNI